MVVVGILPEVCWQSRMRRWWLLLWPSLAGRDDAGRDVIGDVAEDTMEDETEAELISTKGSSPKTLLPIPLDQCRRVHPPKRREYRSQSLSPDHGSSW